MKRTVLRLVSILGVVSLLIGGLSFVGSGKPAQAAFGDRITVSGTQFYAGGERIWMNAANTPWDNWNDFGGSFDYSWWDNHFQQLHDNGINATRVWITCDGEVGINIDSSGYVSGATQAHWDDLDDLFTIAQNNQVYIMATLISWDHFTSGRSGHPNWGAWRNMMESTSNVQAFVDNYVTPFVNRYGSNPWLWSIDLFNEPDWEVAGEGGAESASFSWDQLQEYFARGAKAIHENSDVLVTVGLAMIKYNSDSYDGNKVSDAALQAKVNDPDVYLDFYSPHYYDWQQPYWGNPFYMSPTAFGLDGTKPAMLGENPANGSSGHTITEDYENAYQNGWQGAMGWTSNGVDDNGDLSVLGPATSTFRDNHYDLVFPSGGSDPTDTPVPDPTDTPVPDPTDTPVSDPTDTPVPDPTDTPEPTSTPTGDETETWVDDQDPAITYSGSWTDFDSGRSGQYLETEHESNDSSAYVEYTFDGTGIKLIARNRTWGDSSADVYIDGSYDQTVSFYGSDANQVTIYENTSLADGTHTIRVEHGDNSSYMFVDAFVVVSGGTADPTATPTPEPTNTPEPTDTPVPDPTDTPVPDPTDTPEPTPTPDTDDVKVNFQTSGAAVPSGYLKDAGAAYGDRGNGYTYGWVGGSNNETRERNNHSDQRYDTLNHLQKSNDRTWEIALANGDYTVHVVAGDPSYTDQVNTFEIEGVVVTDPDGEDNFDEYTVDVTVSDGKLTIKPASGSSNSKLCFVDISAGGTTDPTATPTPEPTATPTPEPDPTDTPAPEPTNTPAPTPTPTPDSGVEEVVYDDSTTWADVSWDTSVDFNNTSPVYAGSNSMAVTYNGGWAGLQLERSSPLDTSDYDRITFWAHGGSSGTREIKVFTYDSSNSESNKVSVSIPAGQWSEETVYLSDLGNPADIARVALQDWTGGSQPTFYVDNLKIVGP